VRRRLDVLRPQWLQAKREVKRCESQSAVRLAAHFFQHVDCALGQLEGLFDRSVIAPRRASSPEPVDDQLERGGVGGVGLIEVGHLAADPGA